MLLSRMARIESMLVHDDATTQSEAKKKTSKRVKLSELWRTRERRISSDDDDDEDGRGHHENDDIFLDCVKQQKWQEISISKNMTVQSELDKTNNYHSSSMLAARQNVDLLLLRKRMPSTTTTTVILNGGSDRINSFTINNNRTINRREKFLINSNRITSDERKRAHYSSSSSRRTNTTTTALLYLLFLSTITLTGLYVEACLAQQSHKDDQQTKLSNFHHHHHHQSEHSNDQHHHQQQRLEQQQQQQSFNSEQLQTHEQPLESQRHRRHSSLLPTTTTSDIERAEIELTQKSKTDKEEEHCSELTNLWLYLKTSYPALAAHLRWTYGRQLQRNSKLSKLGNSSISQLLGEAERLLHHQAYYNDSTASGLKQVVSPNAATAWLERVSNSNPNYARLIARLRSKQQQQTLANKSPSQNNEAPHLRPKQHDDEQQITYGRVVHYPHELEVTGSGARQHKALLEMANVALDGDGSYTVAKVRALDKSRPMDARTLLRQKQQLAAASLLDNAAAASAGQSTQAGEQRNQIGKLNGEPQLLPVNIGSVPTEIEQMSANDWRKLDQSATDEARNNFVYGDVKFAPDQVTGVRPSSRLFDNQHRLRLLAETNVSNDEREDGDGEPHHSSHNQRHNKQAGKSALEKIQTTNDDRQSSRQAELSFGQVISNPAPERSQQTYNENELDTTLVSSSDLGDSGAHGGSGGNNEFLGQQRAFQFALDSGDLMLSQRQQDQPSLDEFEGHFHSGPLKQIEVRELRSPAPASSYSSSSQRDEANTLLSHSRRHEIDSGHKLVDLQTSSVSMEPIATLRNVFIDH